MISAELFKKKHKMLKPLDTLNYQQILTILEKLVLEAGNYVMENYGKITDLGKNYSGKNSENEIAKSSLTIVDIGVQKMLYKGLLQNFTDFGMFSEESDDEILELQKQFTHIDTLPNQKYTFIIDPIDGTTCFLNTNPTNHGKKGNPANKDFFGISISLAYGKEIIAGLIYFPALRIVLKTSKGDGTFINNKKIHLDTEAKFDPEDPIRISSSFYKSQKYPNLEKARKQLNNTNFESMVYNTLALLQGNLKAYITSRVDLLDFACMGLAYKEAGGYICNENAQEIDLKNYVYEHSEGINLQGFFSLTSNKQYFEELMKHSSLLI